MSRQSDPTPMEPPETDFAGLLSAMAARAIAAGWNEREVVVVHPDGRPFTDEELAEWDAEDEAGT